MREFRQHAEMRGIYINRRAERLLGIALAAAIGVGLGAVLALG